MLRAGDPAVAQAGVLKGPRVRLKNGLARTKTGADLGAGDAAPLYPVSSPAGPQRRWQLIMKTLHARSHADAVRVPPATFQPIAPDDVAEALARVLQADADRKIRK